MRVRHIVNKTERSGKVWHDLSSDHFTVAVLLHHRGGTIETRPSVWRSVKRHQNHTAQIDIIPPGNSVWGYAEGLQSTRSVRLFASEQQLRNLVGDDLDTRRLRSPTLMHRDDRITQIASLLAQECRSSASPTIYGEGLTVALLSALFSQFRHSREKCASLTPAQLRLATEFFEQHIPNPLSLASVANELRMSQSSFARSFKAATGVSPYLWFLQARIRYAQQLLLAHEPIASVATRTGFAGQSHFTKCFQRLTGTTPRLWQRDRS